ncbi:MAG TPA: TIGR04190 family B12-binding domain/radical SAM domain protein [Anaerolineales bacterium]|nr:TIGR04190 family B12-binding domain/radical SAM domain protein [Anaerolineae bacterium]HIQ02168.1 TIGR04190 family B12-binding domain/radical SAM domain protein [Anaerolineales bacterium]
MSTPDLTFLHAPSVYDFRRRATLWGPISDVVPSEPIYDMYPIGFAALSDYLERHGFRARIVNLAVRMLRSDSFDVERFIGRLRSLAFGIDLHWLPHAQGALEVARIVRQHHPDTPVIFGGFSATYFHKELIRYPQVDYVVRGDSTEEPLRQLMACLRDGREPVDVPNLTWKDASGRVHINPQSYLPADLAHVRPGFRQMVRAVIRDRDLLSYAPFERWLNYPIMATLTVRGCKQNCAVCGGCAKGHERMSGRTRPAFRSPEDLAADVREARRISRGPIFILGELRLAGIDYARRFLQAVQGVPGPFMIEFFWPVPRDYAEELAAALPDFIVEFSPDSHDPAVRKALGKHYSNEGIEETVRNCLAVGARRFDLFFMIGLPRQTPASALETATFCEHLLQAVDGDPRLTPFTAPLAPFLDPASPAFEEPDRFGYRLHYRTLEEHRRALLAPTWKHILSYETQWMDRDTLAATTYEAGRRLNRLKARYGIISLEKAAETEERIERAISLMDHIDRLLATRPPEEIEREMMALKDQIDRANTSTVCDKRELDVPVGRVPFNAGELARLGASEVWRMIWSKDGR